jgi:hypothetical protein
MAPRSIADNDRRRGRAALQVVPRESQSGERMTAPSQNAGLGSSTDKLAPTASDSQITPSGRLWSLVSSKPSFSVAAGQRESRLDLFRGLALWLIYLDHVSPDILTWGTLRSYGFSDAAEIFIFISGYTAALVYGRITFASGFVIGTARALRRVWQIYTAHLLLFFTLMAEIAYVMTISEKPSFYVQEMEVGEFFKQPGPTIIQALLLRFRPLNMDVLPLYVALMAFLPPIFQLAKLQRDLPLVLSICFYILTLRYDLHLSTFGGGFWSFNPCAWQLLFVFGAWCAMGGGRRLSPIRNSSLVLWGAAAYLCAAFFVTLSWYFPGLESLIPGWLGRLIYPINKTDFDILRFAHFLALATIAVRFVPTDWAGLKSPWVRPLILCGQYSLQIFAVGVALSFAGYALLTELDAGVLLHLIVGVAGILILCGIAWTFARYKQASTTR